MLAVPNTGKRKEHLLFAARWGVAARKGSRKKTKEGIRRESSEPEDEREKTANVRD